MPDPASGASALTLRFTSEDLDRFAAASGDVNPLHVDPAFARRSAYGRCVVHGALTSLGLLGALAPAEQAAVRSLRAWFPGAALLDSTLAVEVAPARGDAPAWEIRLIGRGKVLTRVVTSAATAAPGAIAAGVEAQPAAAARVMLTEPAQHPRSDEGCEIAGSYRTGALLREVAARLGAAALRPALLEGLAWASYAVGMELPGRHALFAAVTLEAAGEDAARDGAAAGQLIRVRSHDERTGRLLLDGALFDAAGAPQSRALIECFALAPTPPADPVALGIAPPTAPVRGAVVVIGGSRGFGAALSLSLLAHDYAVHVVYSTAVESAAALATAAGPLRDRLFLHRADARDAGALEPLAAAVRGGGAPLVGIVLNAAPPPIPMSVTAQAGDELAQYVAESLRLTAVPLGALLGQLDAQSGWVLFCSSPAVIAPPRDWPHYAAAKGALEGLARWLAVASPKARSIIVRPPKMVTDLTNTPSGRIAAAPTEIVAAWIVERIAGGSLTPGVSVLEPDAAAFAAPAVSA